MGFRMIEPWKNPRSKFLWFRKRVPERFVALMGRREIKFSLGIKDPDEAQLRCVEENLKIERMWQDHAAGRPPGRELDYRQVVALAGEFYKETVEKHRSNPGKAADWESSIARDRTLRQLRSFPLTPAQHRRFLFGEQVRAFLEGRNLTLAPTTFDAFVKEYLEAKTQAESVLARNARGDFSPDRSADRFPEWTPMSDEQRLPKLWEEFVADRQVSRSTRKKYKGILDGLVARIGTDDMSMVAEHHLSEWIDELKRSKSRKTVKEGYAAALKSFFGWAKRNKKLPTNPAAEIFVEPTAQTPQKRRGFNDVEAGLILAATLAPVSHLMTSENAAARRWVPWLCAYTGARVNEVTQLRESDVFPVLGLPCVRITPEAGSVKDTKMRIVPLHPHLIDEGFLKYVGSRPGGAPLFYSLARQRKKDRVNPTYASVGNKLAEWVRGLGIDDPNVAPSHGWRHRFKTVSRRAKMDRFIVHAIQGHAIETEGDDYGEVEVEVMYREILKHPQYTVTALKSVDRRRKTRAASDNDKK